MSFSKTVDAPCANRTLRKRFNPNRDPSPMGRSTVFDGPRQNSFRPGVRMSDARVNDRTGLIGGEGTTNESKARGGRARTPTGRQETVHNPPFALQDSKSDPYLKGKRPLTSPIRDQGVMNHPPMSPGERTQLYSPMQKDSPVQRFKNTNGKGSVTGNHQRPSVVFDGPADGQTAAGMQRFRSRPAVVDQAGIQQQNVDAYRGGKTIRPPSGSLTGILAPETRQVKVNQTYRPQAPWQK